VLPYIAAALVYCIKNVSCTDMHALNASARTQRKPVKQVTTIDAMFPQQPSHSTSLTIHRMTRTSHFFPWLKAAGIPKMVNKFENRICSVTLLLIHTD
jgi:hypothetical protein